MAETETRICEVCEKLYSSDTLQVASLPGIPMTVARCIDCFAADVVPIWVAVATTAELGGLENAADWWKEVIADTLAYLKIPRTDFDTLVGDAMDRYAEVDAL